MGRNDEETSWIDDAFDDKKAAREEASSGMGGGMKVALGAGCLAAFVLIAVLVVLAVASLSALASA
ncbi:hypothetical protein [Gordonibacter sp. Marseille-P4307]|uniref:hypothetical protein n=1 Tax=Gordonibacter sp. Marseille-P4307 TaxID=2161815 RepID=UPI000F54BCD1|nr:hypothetical protein [Gordonibacter sp. Marseille-P4307]